jgi:hypothetical protein
MKSKMLAVVAIAAGVSLTACGTTTSASLSDHTAKNVPGGQVTGAQLYSAMLPPSAFGAYMKDAGGLADANTGKKLMSSHSSEQVSTTSCSTFETDSLNPAFGKTAQAQEGSYNSKPSPLLPTTPFVAFQFVSQFASAQAATTFYNQAHAKFKACTAFTWPAAETNYPERGDLRVTTQSMSDTTVSNYPAFSLSQLTVYTKKPNPSIINTLVTVAGANVYLIYVINITQDEPSHAVMSQLISRVQKLY